ncbi:MAG: hypothetical protein M1514_00110, partial [Patescibacteria group bacterium]|nr:hypothetical protein [Patescibacteria group bacterium]
IPNYQPFRLLICLPAFYLLLALGLMTIKEKLWQGLLTTLILTINLASLIVYYREPYFQREDWRGVVKFLIKEEKTVILPSSTSDWPIKYYDQAKRINLISGSQGIAKVGDLGNMGNLREKIFYIRYLTLLFDPQEEILNELKRQNYSKIKEISFNQISIWEFQKNEDWY